MKFNFNFKTNFEFDVEVNVRGFTPGKEAPFCQDHDSPRFSDSGYDADFDRYDCNFVFEYNGKKIRIEFPEELYNVIEDKLHDEIREQGENFIKNDFDDMDYRQEA